MLFPHHRHHHCHLPAIILVNNDLVAQVEGVLVEQLFITETMTGVEFDARIAEDPNYPHIVHQQNFRIMIIRSFRDFTNRELMDLVLFIKDGLAYIECNKRGPSGKTMQIAYLHLEKLLLHPPIGCCGEWLPKNECHIQSNILHPLFPDAKKPAHFPFGSDHNRLQDTIFWTLPYPHFEPAGALIPRCPEEHHCQEDCHCACDRCER